MSAAYIMFKNGKTVAVTRTALTTPAIANGLPKGNPAGDQGTVSKSGSAVNR